MKVFSHVNYFRGAKIQEYPQTKRSACIDLGKCVLARNYAPLLCFGKIGGSWDLSHSEININLLIFNLYHIHATKCGVIVYLN